MISQFARSVMMAGLLSSEGPSVGFPPPPSSPEAPPLPLGSVGSVSPGWETEDGSVGSVASDGSVSAGGSVSDGSVGSVGSVSSGSEEFSIGSAPCPSGRMDAQCALP